MDIIAIISTLVIIISCISYLARFWKISFKPFDKLTDEQKELANSYHQKSASKGSLEEYLKKTKILCIVFLLALVLVILLWVGLIIYLV